MRARELGLVVGELPTGPQNAITDVAGVHVGHTTLVRGTSVRTGVTAILPHAGNLFRDRVYAGASAFNGYGQLASSLVIEEWGLIGSPVVITDTVGAGVGYSAVVEHLVAHDASAGIADVPMPVVAECDDGFLNDNRTPVLTTADVRAAIDGAAGGAVAEGSVGAGTGMQLFEHKGGIGTASRVVGRDGGAYTVGVLVNTNFGLARQLTILGAPVGRELAPGGGRAPDRSRPRRHGEGSCVVVVATDAPLHPLQLRRLARRSDVGLARTGSVAHDGSGEIALAFSTAQLIPREQREPVRRVALIPEGQDWRAGTLLDDLFAAVAEATEEAVLNALFQARTVTGRAGNTLHRLDPDAALATLARLSPWAFGKMDAA